VNFVPTESRRRGVIVRETSDRSHFKMRALVSKNVLVHPVRPTMILASLNPSFLNG
jgi:hypothetical protein